VSAVGPREPEDQPVVLAIDETQQFVTGTPRSGKSDFTRLLQLAKSAPAGLVLGPDVQEDNR
jgi:hypothetical protein